MEDIQDTSSHQQSIHETLTSDTSPDKGNDQTTPEPIKKDKGKIPISDDLQITQPLDTTNSYPNQ
jgi:hypothetical protein